MNWDCRMQTSITLQQAQTWRGSKQLLDARC